VFSWWFGAMVGLVHGAFVLAVGVPCCRAAPADGERAPRPDGGAAARASRLHGAHYGVRTPISVSSRTRSTAGFWVFYLPLR